MFDDAFKMNLTSFATELDSLALAKNDATTAADAREEVLEQLQVSASVLSQWCPLDETTLQTILPHSCLAGMSAFLGTRNHFWHQLSEGLPVLLDFGHPPCPVEELSYWRSGPMNALAIFNPCETIGKEVTHGKFGQTVRSNALKFSMMKCVEEFPNAVIEFAKSFNSKSMPDVTHLETATLDGVSMIHETAEYFMKTWLHLDDGSVLHNLQGEFCMSAAFLTMLPTMAKLSMHVAAIKALDLPPVFKEISESLPMVTETGEALRSFERMRKDVEAITSRDAVEADNNEILDLMQQLSKEECVSGLTAICSTSGEALKEAIGKIQEMEAGTGFNMAEKRMADAKLDDDTITSLASLVQKPWACDLYRNVRSAPWASFCHLREAVSVTARNNDLNEDMKELFEEASLHEEPVFSKANRMLSNLAILQACCRPLGPGEDRKSCLERCKRGCENNGFNPDDHIREYVLRLEAKCATVATVEAAKCTMAGVVDADA